jgi:hypothetical protein
VGQPICLESLFDALHALFCGALLFKWSPGLIGSVQNKHRSSQNQHRHHHGHHNATALQGCRRQWAKWDGCIKVHGN